MQRHGGSSTSDRLVTQQVLTHAQGVGSVSFAGIEDDPDMKDVLKKIKVPKSEKEESKNKLL